MNDLKMKVNIRAECRRNGKLIWKDEVHNLVAYAGIQKIFKRLASETADNTNINYAALGTGLTAATVNDTQLQTEVYRNTSPITTASGNQLFADAVFEPGEVSGTFTEFGYFIDGSAGANSGDLWNRVLVNWVKTSLDTLFVRATFTLTNA